MIKRLIGIDFGTSTTIIHIKNYRDGRPADNDKMSVQYVEFDGHGLVPTLIQKVDDIYYFGYDAKQQKKGGCLYRNFKLDLESKDSEVRKKAMELTRMFFYFLHDAYEEQKMHFGESKYEKTLVSYPAKWKKETRDFMISCAIEAGFQNVQGIDEPKAALYSVFVQEQEKIKMLGTIDKDHPSYILMVDMGAGTTDLILCRYATSGNPEILLTWPNSEKPVFFGGHEIDILLMDILKNYLLDNGFSNDGVNRFIRQYEETCKTWKENTVSSVLNKGKQVDFCFFISSVFQIMGITPSKFPVISRESLEIKAGGYLKTYAILVNGLLHEAAKTVKGFTGGEMIDLVILTGGHSQWYFAKDILSGVIDTGIQISMDKIRKQPERIVRISRPQETVARGMVYTAQNISYDVQNEDSVEEQPPFDENPSEERIQEEIHSGLDEESEMIDGSRQGYEQMINKKIAKKRFGLLFDYQNNSAMETFQRCNSLYHKALQAHLGDLHIQSDQDFINDRQRESPKLEIPTQELLEKFMLVYRKPLTTGKERILFYFTLNSAIFGQKLQNWLVTSEKMLRLNAEQTMITEYFFKDIRYFTTGEKFINRNWEEVSLGEWNEIGWDDRKLILSIYARWRATNGKDPYRMDLIDYYEEQRDTPIGKSGKVLNEVGLFYKTESTEKALPFFEKASDAGENDSLLNIAECHYRGIKGVKDYGLAAAYVERFTGLMTGGEKIPAFIGKMYENGGYGLTPDISKAMLYYDLNGNKWEVTRLKTKKVFDFFKK